MFWNDQTSQADAVCDFDYWGSFFDVGQRYLKGQSSTANAHIHADGVDFKGPDVWVNPACKLYVYADRGRGRVSDTGHAYVGLIDEAGNDMRVGFYAAETLYTHMDPGMGVAIAAPVGGWLIGRAAFTALSFLVPGLGWVRVAQIAVGLATAAAAMKELAVGLGELKDEFDHEFHWCVGWDITRRQLLAARALMREWKQRSDQNNLIYDLAGSRTTETA